MREMQLEFVPLVSGSSGNAVYVGAPGARMLVDAGVSAVRLMQQMQAAGLDPRGVDALLVTHEHSDHVSGVGVMSRKLNLPVYATEGTWAGMRNKLGAIDPHNVRYIYPGQDFYIGPVNVMPFPIPHDAAEPVGYSFTLGAMKCAIATDIGCVKASWMDELVGSDVVLLEANHDVEMLKAGRYPYDLKKRILSRHGHLSNEDCARAAVELCSRGVRRIILGHLSQENNLPELALLTVKNALADSGVELGNAFFLDVARRDQYSCVVRIGDGRDGD